MVRTHLDYLIEQHGLDPKWNPSVECACGRVTAADMCVDVTPLPPEMLHALGLENVHYLCDGCQTRLFREHYVWEAEFYGLLGTSEEALHTHNMRDNEHQQGVSHRHGIHQPKHERVTHAKVKGKQKHEIARALIPLHTRNRTHVQSATWLARKYSLTNIPEV